MTLQSRVDLRIYSTDGSLFYSSIFPNMMTTWDPEISVRYKAMELYIKGIWENNLILIYSKRPKDRIRKNGLDIINCKISLKI